MINVSDINEAMKHKSDIELREYLQELHKNGKVDVAILQMWLEDTVTEELFSIKKKAILKNSVWIHELIPDESDDDDADIPEMVFLPEPKKVYDASISKSEMKRRRRKAMTGLDLADSEDREVILWRLLSVIRDTGEWYSYFNQNTSLF